MRWRDHSGNPISEGHGMACAEDAGATVVVVAVAAVFFLSWSNCTSEEQEETHLTRTAA